MIDPLVQEVRDIRAAIAEQFGFDRTRIIAWARAQTIARKASLANAKANNSLPVNNQGSKSFYESEAASAPHPCQS